MGRAKGGVLQRFLSAVNGGFVERRGSVARGVQAILAKEGQIFRSSDLAEGGTFKRGRNLVDTYRKSANKSLMARELGLANFPTSAWACRLIGSGPNARRSRFFRKREIRRGGSEDSSPELQKGKPAHKWR